MSIQKVVPNKYDLETRIRRDFSELTGNFIYILCNEQGYVKIGTTSNIWSRMKQIRSGSAEKLELLMIWVCNEARKTESALHTIFSKNRLHSEWFDIGSSEHNIWRYILLTNIALQTAIRIPILVNFSLYFSIQYGHIPHNDPCWDEPGGSDLTGRELYSSELLVKFRHEWGSDKITLYGTPDGNEKILQDYHLSGL